MPNSSVPRTVADAPSATAEKLSDVRGVRNCGITEGSSAHLGALDL